MLKTITSILLLSICLSSSAGQKIIYGDNNLTYIEHSLDKSKREVAKSVAMIVNSDELETVFESILYKLNSSTLASTAPMCDDMPWNNEIALGTCSGVLISDDEVLTAAHCLVRDNFKCDTKAFLFDVKANFMMGTKGQYFTQEQVYRCKEVSSYALDPDTGLDYAIIKLDRSVVKRSAPKIDHFSFSKPQQGDELFMIGHPLGLGSMISTNGYIRQTTQDFYVTELDSFVGNSGAPVFSSIDNSLIGILSQGEEDFVWNAKQECFELNVCKSGECRGEDVVKIESILDHHDLNK